MALRNQPYLPLYVQDFMSDEKLNECSAESVGVYIRLMCVMHKSEDYGVIHMKAKYKQNASKHKNFAELLSRHMPYTLREIESSLVELDENRVIDISDDVLSQRRMVRDGGLSRKRAIAGSAGGKTRKNSPTQKLYNEPGHIYVVGDQSAEGGYKVGITKDTRKRLIQLSNKTGRDLMLLHSVECPDMGMAENDVLEFFKENTDGEWVFGVELERIISKINDVVSNQIASKTQANTEIESEYEGDTEMIGNGQEDTTPREDSNTLGARFDEFWAAYPRKVGKGAARKSWEKIKPSATLHKKIMTAVSDARVSEDWLREDGRFIPNPATWLNQSRWEDELKKVQGERRQYKNGDRNEKGQTYLNGKWVNV